MGYLIILRGPPGVGKTTIARHLTERLGSDKAVILYLDKMEEFDLNVQKAFGSEYVIGELFFGDSHTTRPEQWLNKFTGYSKISFILHFFSLFSETLFSLLRNFLYTGSVE